MRKKGIKKFHLKRKSIPTFPGRAKMPRIALYSKMFREDVAIGIMPIYSSSTREQYDIVLEGHEKAKSAAFSLLNSISKGSSKDSHYLLSRSIQELGERLSWYGMSLYEITRENAKSNMLVLNSFTASNLVSLRYFYIQLVPREDREYINKRMIFINGKDVWRISMPRVLGGYRRYIKVLSGLDSVLPKLPVSSLDNMGRNSHIQFTPDNYTRYIRMNTIKRMTITRTFGWPGRERITEYDTEFYNHYRSITLGWAQAIIREHIIYELNKLFARLRIDSRIVLTGLPTSDDILRTRDNLRDGCIQFREAFKKAAL